MKKLILLFLCCALMGGSICNAEIAKGVDQFTGGIKFISGVKGDDEATLRSLLFKKILSGNTEEYFMEADNFSYKDHALTDNFIEMRIDDNPTYTCIKHAYMDVGPMEGKFLAILTVKVPEEAIMQLKDAKRVALRFARNNGFQFVYVLPSEVLAEWKEVIKMEA